jgi:hypothetical protein
MRWFWWWPGARLDLVRSDQRCSRESWKTTLESQGTYSENWHGDSLKKVQLTLSQGKKKRDEVADDKDDGWCSENQCVTRPSESNTVYWGIVPQHSVYIALPTYQMGNHVWGGGTDCQHDTFGRPSWGSHLPARPSPRVTEFPIKLDIFHTISLWLDRQYCSFFYSHQVRVCYQVRGCHRFGGVPVSLSQGCHYVIESGVSLQSGCLRPGVCETGTSLINWFIDAEISGPWPLS